MTTIVFVVILLGLIVLGVSLPVALGFAALVGSVFNDGARIPLVEVLVLGGARDYVAVSILLFVFYSRICREMNVRARLSSTFSALFGAGPLASSTGEALASLLQPDAGGDAVLQRHDDAVATVNTLQLAGTPPWSAVGQAAILTFLRMITPPSILLIVIAIIAGQPILYVFAGTAPIALACAALVVLLAAISRTADGRVPDTNAQPLRVEAGALVWLLAPVVVIGSLIGGVLTPTEAGSVAVAFALVVGFLQRRLSSRRLLRASLDALQDAGAIILVLLLANLASAVLASHGVTELAKGTFAGMASNLTMGTAHSSVPCSSWRPAPSLDLHSRHCCCFL